MKKIIVAFFAVFAILGLSACGKKEYKFDGDFLAYEVSIYNDDPQITYVTVTVKNGKVVAYNLDERQTTAVKEAGVVVGYTWNEQTKKELKEDYGMNAIPSSSGEGPSLEWYLQAELIEAKWLEDGPDSLTVNENGKIDNLAGATMADTNYTKLAKEAVANAKAGKHNAFVLDDAGNEITLYSIEGELKNKNAFKKITIDTLQSKVTAGVFAWNAKTKQELGAEYGMKDIGPGYAFENGAWKVEGKCTLEWNEQVDLITNYVVKNGYANKLVSIGERGASLDGTTLVDELAGVTVKSDFYFELLDLLFALI